MPSNVVKTKVDENKWEMAKEKAKEQGQSNNYPYIMAIYKSMKGEKKKEFSLENHLMKKLNITLEEASLIKSLIKKYLKEKYKR
jgi:hypothetical protein